MAQVTAIGEQRRARESRAAPALTYDEKRTSALLGAASGFAWAALFLPVAAFGRLAVTGTPWAAYSAGAAGLGAALAFYALAALSVRLGRKPVVLGALALGVAGALVAAFMAAGAGRLIMGGAAVTAVLSGWLSDGLSPDARPRAQAGLDMGHALGAATGLCAGMFLTTGQALIGSALLLAAAAAVTALQKPPPLSDCPRPPAAAELALAAKEPHFKSSLAAGFGLAFAAGAMFATSTIPPFAPSAAVAAAALGMIAAARLRSKEGFAAALAVACAGALLVATGAVQGDLPAALAPAAFPAFAFFFAGGQVALPAFIAARSAEVARPGVFHASQAAAAAGLFFGALAALAVHLR
jgi:MFS family permease